MTYKWVKKMPGGQGTSWEVLSNQLLLCIGFPRLAVCPSKVIFQIVGMCSVCQVLKCFPEVSFTASTCANMCLKQTVFVSRLDLKHLAYTDQLFASYAAFGKLQLVLTSWVHLFITYPCSKHTSFTKNCHIHICFNASILILVCSRFPLIDFQVAYLCHHEQ